MTIRPFEIRVPDAALADLADRLARTRWLPDEATDWEAGTSPAYLRELVDHWRSGYDWRAREAALNQHPQFLVELGDATVHFIHVRGTGSAPLPLILTHGYPDSFVRFQKIIPLLTDPAAHGGDPADAFDVVVPSLPGYGFSDRPSGRGGRPDGGSKTGDIFHIVDLWHRLMTELGYGRYGAHGGDWGSTVTEHLARSHGRSLIGIHLTDVPFWHGFQKPHGLSPAEQAYLRDIDSFQQREGAYAMIQGTRPYTLADGLGDSPAGLAAWIIEKFRRWSDCGGELERVFTKDELIDNLMIYWTTQSIGSAFLPYHDVMSASVARWVVEKAKDLVARTPVPAGFALFPQDLSHPPRAWAERFFHVRRWTQMPRGGHFAAMEQPELLAQDLRAFFRPLRAS